MQTDIQFKRNIEPTVAIVTITWALIAFYLGYTNSFAQWPLPFFGITVITLLTSLLILYSRHHAFQRWCDGIPVKTIALFHSWRILAGWAFLSYSDVLPITFVNNAAYGDILSGMLGLAVFIFGFTKRNFLFFNVVGMLDFLLAVGTGLTLTIMGEDKMAGIAQLPLIMIPLFGVPISGFTHIISLVRIAKAKHLNGNQIIY